MPLTHLFKVLAGIYSAELRITTTTSVERTSTSLLHILGSKFPTQNNAEALGCVFTENPAKHHELTQY